MRDRRFPSDRSVTSRRAFLRSLAVTGTVAATAGLVSGQQNTPGADDAQPPVFSSGALTGSQEVPPVETSARGTALFQRARETREVRYVLVLDAIENVTQAHVHLGREGENGPAVAFLFGREVGEGRFVGPREEGVTIDDLTSLSDGVTREELVGPLENEPLGRLLSEMRDGNTYVNVHTEQYPDGEVRGQIRQIPLG